MIKTNLKIPNGVQFIAIFEAAKGTLVLVVGIGLLTLVHKDLQALAERLVEHSHLNPASHYPRIFIEAAANANDSKLRLLAALAFVYALFRFIEAYGLWKLRAWAEWLAIISGSIYIPIEIYELYQRATIVRAALLIANLLIVAYLVRVRWTKKHSALQIS
ncbi:MAG: DUF2127 domain-containing protein [Pyrinomonadaceae bacterium]